jgi:hypothetical protein
VEHGRVLCFQFDGANPAETTIGPFDSGGPMYSTDEESGERTLIGIARGSEAVPGSNGELRMARYVDLTDPFYESWLAEHAFSESPVPKAFRVEKFYTDEVRELKADSTADYTFDVRESTIRLILTLNHDPGSSETSNNLDLKLPKDIDATCERHASVEVCHVENPPAGAYRLSVGWGEQCVLDVKCAESNDEVAYQMTAIAVYDDISTPSGGTRAVGNE